MSRSLSVSYWITALLLIPAAGLFVRIFIIFHDCCHNSFFNSRRANDILGFITGFLTFTPYRDWQQKHAIHHANAADLDRRGMGDVWTLTVQEYLESSLWKKFAYRLARNPFILFVIAPLFLFLIQYRVPSFGTDKRARYSVLWTNLAILGIASAISSLFGIRSYLIIQLAIMIVAGSAGVWLFYVQHQFDGVYWARHSNWDYAKAALQGSSFYKLPKILQWFSGNIGFHHVHHLSPRIPNYNLEMCHKADPLIESVKPVTLLSSLKSFRFRLWDEELQIPVGYGHLRTVRKHKPGRFAFKFSFFNLLKP
ncbi:MAG TPA: fatty acid desaturase [Acidobacteriota bacterium]|nr:fatty acid desaturase [Acidobacteriota bacterium]